MVSNPAKRAWAQNNGVPQSVTKMTKFGRILVISLKRMAGQFRAVPKCFQARGLILLKIFFRGFSKFLENLPNIYSQKIRVDTIICIHFLLDAPKKSKTTNFSRSIPPPPGTCLPPKNPKEPEQLQGLEGWRVLFLLLWKCCLLVQEKEAISFDFRSGRIINGTRGALSINP